MTRFLTSSSVAEKDARDLTTDAAGAESFKSVGCSPNCEEPAQAEPGATFPCIDRLRQERPRRTRLFVKKGPNSTKPLLHGLYSTHSNRRENNPELDPLYAVGIRSSRCSALSYVGCAESHHTVMKGSVDSVVGFLMCGLSGERQSGLGADSRHHSKVVRALRVGYAWLASAGARAMQRACARCALPEFRGSCSLRRSWRPFWSRRASARRPCLGIQGGGRAGNRVGWGQTSGSEVRRPMDWLQVASPSSDCARKGATGRIRISAPSPQSWRDVGRRSLSPDSTIHRIGAKLATPSDRSRGSVSGPCRFVLRTRGERAHLLGQNSALWGNLAPFATVLAQIRSLLGHFRAELRRHSLRTSGLCPHTESASCIRAAWQPERLRTDVRNPRPYKPPIAPANVGVEVDFAGLFFRCGCLCCHLGLWKLAFQSGLGIPLLSRTPCISASPITNTPVGLSSLWAGRPGEQRWKIVRGPERRVASGGAEVEDFYQREMLLTRFDLCFSPETSGDRQREPHIRASRCEECISSPAVPSGHRLRWNFGFAWEKCCSRLQPSV